MYILQQKLHVYVHNLNVYLVLRLPLPFAGIYHSQISKILLTEYCKVQTLKKEFFYYFEFKNPFISSCHQQMGVMVILLPYAYFT